MFHPYALLGYAAFFLVLELLRRLLSREIFKGYTREEFWKSIVVIGLIQIVALVVFQVILLPVLTALFGFLLENWHPESRLKIVLGFISVAHDFLTSYSDILSGNESVKGYVLGVATFEEITKFVFAFVAALVVLKGKQYHPLSYLIIASAGFGIIENVHFYSRFHPEEVGLVPYILRAFVAPLHIAFSLSNLVSLVVGPLLVFLGMLYYGWFFMLIYFLILVLLAFLRSKDHSISDEGPYHLLPLISFLQFYFNPDILPIWIKVLSFPGVMCHAYYDILGFDGGWTIYIPLIIMILTLWVFENYSQKIFRVFTSETKPPLSPPKTVPPLPDEPSDQPECPYCYKKALVKKGRNAAGIQRFYCKTCQKSFLLPE